MKLFLSVSLAIMLGACVTTTEHDLDRAYAKCASNVNKTSRDRCISDAVLDYERDRERAAREQQDDIDEAETRALNREIAGARED